MLQKRNLFSHVCIPIRKRKFAASLLDKSPHLKNKNQMLFLVAMIFFVISWTHTGLV